MPPALTLARIGQSCHISWAANCTVALFQCDALHHVGVKRDVRCFHDTTFLNCPEANTSMWSIKKSWILIHRDASLVWPWHKCRERIKASGRTGQMGGLSPLFWERLWLYKHSLTEMNKNIFCGKCCLHWAFSPARWYANLTTRSWAGALQLATFLYQFW